MAIRKPGIAKKQVVGDVPVAPSIKFAADQLIRKTKKIINDVIRAYKGEFVYLDLVSSAGINIRMETYGGHLYVAQTDGGLSGLSLQHGLETGGNILGLPLDGSNQMYFYEVNLGDEAWFRITRLGEDDYKVEQLVSNSYVEIENVTASQSKVDTHAADTSTHGAAEVADVATVSAEIDGDITTHAALTATHGVSEVADAADLATHAAKTGDTHGLGPTATFESTSGAQTKVNTHAAVTNTHGAAEVADVATVSAEIDSDISTHAADTSTHGVATVADAADLTTHEADTSTHGVAEVADDSGKGARVYRDSDQSIPDGTPTIITSYNQEQYDQDTIHDVSTNPSRLTCKTAGKYIITGNVIFGSDDTLTGIRELSLFLNGTTEICKDRKGATNEYPTCLVSTIYDLAVNDYLELQVFQNSGGALAVSYSAAFSPYFAMQRISG